MRIILTTILIVMLNTGLSSPLLVKDDSTNLYPKRYRSTVRLSPSFAPKLIASGQFNQQQLLTIINEHPDKQLVVIDLRQESHGFINGKIPISWYDIKNWGNKGKSDQEIIVLEQQNLDTVLDNHSAIIHEIVSKTIDGYIDKTIKHQLYIEETSTELDLLKSMGIGYFRLMTTDKHPIDDEHINHWITFLNKMDTRNTIYYIHCRGGSGRTTQLMILTDIWFHGDDSSLNTIIDRQVAWGGKDIRQLPEPVNYKYPKAKERLKLINDFYLFKRQYNNGEKDFHQWRISQNFPMN